MNLPAVLRAIVLDYAMEWQLLDWIYESEINWAYLGYNIHPGAVAFMLRYPHKAKWGHASANPDAWSYLRDHPELIDHFFVGENTNPDAVAYAIKNLATIERQDLSANPAAIDWLIANPEYVDWEGLSGNPHPAAEALLVTRPAEIDWHEINLNPAPWAIRMIKANPDKREMSLAGNSAGFDILTSWAKERGIPLEIFVDWQHLSDNSDPRAVELAITQPGKIHWDGFSQVPTAIGHLQRHKNSVNWNTLFENPAIFQLKLPTGLADIV